MTRNDKTPGGLVRWLIDRRQISVRTGFEVLEAQFRRMPSLASVFISAGLMSEELALDVLDMQLENPHRGDFAQIARDPGYLTEDEIARCIDVQHSLRPRVGELLCELGHVEEGELRDALQAAQRDRDSGMG